ncbi:MAG: pantoate--beta-alanine ligase, partial [Candidatus Omnitrophica bacterium]|nr:pantoate--beta-alanine ligase [Candidatus Omnitrophota bacterium]
TVGFVPTMGALHEAHLGLIRRAQRDNDFTVVSIFVNPAQFAPAEDFKKYPRDIKGDARLCKKEGVDILFCPTVKEMYPEDFSSFVEVKGLSGVLCGKSRPGHFRGVATIVTKLFNIVSPDVAYFGQKDAQQALIIKRLVRDLNLPVKIKVLPIIRDKDGLALSSRNRYLSGAERKDASVLFSALKLARGLVNKGIRDPREIVRRVSGLIKTKKKARIDYVSVVDLGNFGPVKKIKDNCLIALAVWLGETRLIDNIIISGKRN